MNNNPYKYDVIVIGGGLSGCEAATTSARNGLKTLLLSINMDTVGYLQFGNYFNYDRNNVLFQALEKYGSKIPGIICKNRLIKIEGKKNYFKRLEGHWIVDRKRFGLDIKSMIEGHDNLETRQGMAANIENTENGYILETSDSLKIKAEALIVCAGTFLNARMVWGDNSLKAGRPGEIQSSRLYINLCKKGLEFIDGKYLSAPKILKSTVNHNSKNLEILRTKKLEAYAIKTKISVIGHGGKRELILIPEGKDTEEMYVSGFENDLPENEQVNILTGIKGLEDVYMTRPGYGIKFACLSPAKQKKDLKIKTEAGIFFAGRIKGAVFYEDSLVQGFLAGVNAVKKLTGYKIFEPEKILEVFDRR